MLVFYCVGLISFGSPPQRLPWLMWLGAVAAGWQQLLKQRGTAARNFEVDGGGWRGSFCSMDASVAPETLAPGRSVAAVATTQFPAVHRRCRRSNIPAQTSPPAQLHCFSRTPSSPRRSPGG